MVSSAESAWELGLVAIISRPQLQASLKRPFVFKARREASSFLLILPLYEQGTRQMSILNIKRRISGQTCAHQLDITSGLDGLHCLNTKSFIARLIVINGNGEVAHAPYILKTKSIMMLPNSREARKTYYKSHNDAKCRSLKMKQPTDGVTDG